MVSAQRLAFALVFMGLYYLFKQAVCVKLSFFSKSLLLDHWLLGPSPSVTLEIAPSAYIGHLSDISRT
jgi:hypothetical protein